jgi:alpha-L-fucosidase
MNRRIVSAYFFCTAFLLGVRPGFAGTEAPRNKYESTWESLDQHQTPEWFMDAKLGFKIQPPHPTQAEYQAYWAERGEPNKEYLYGAGAWDQAQWDPDGLAQLAVDMGARYVVFSHGTVDVFLNHPSKYADIEGSPFTRYGPTGCDMLGDVAEAVRKRGLRFGIYCIRIAIPSGST